MQALILIRALPAQLFLKQLLYILPIIGLIGADAVHVYIDQGGDLACAVASAQGSF